MNNNKKIPDPEELSNAEEDAKTKSLCTAVIPPIKTSIIEKTSTTFLGKAKLTKIGPNWPKINHA